MNDRTYLIIPASEVKKVNFDEVMEHSPKTLSYSKDGKRTFIKWKDSEPSFVSKIKNSEGPYTHKEILEIIRGDEWIGKPTKKVT